MTLILVRYYTVLVESLATAVSNYTRTCKLFEIHGFSDCHQIVSLLNLAAFSALQRSKNGGKLFVPLVNVAEFDDCPHKLALSSNSYQHRDRGVRDCSKIFVKSLHLFRVY